MALDILTKITSAFGHNLKHDENRFDELVLALKEALGPSSGLDSADVDVHELMKLMEEYNTTESEWVQFAFAEKSMGYTRNLVDEGNGKSNLVSPAARLRGMLSRADINTARACLDARQGQSHPRPWQRPLPDENPQGRLD